MPCTRASARLARSPASPRLAPQPELQPAVPDHLVRHQPQQHDPGGRPLRLPGGGPGQPAVELPAHPVGDRGRGQQPLVPPDPVQLLAVLGLRLDRQPGAGQPAPDSPSCSLLGQRPGGEGGGVDPVDRRVELDRARPAPAAGTRAASGRSSWPAGQPVRAGPVRTEPGQHVARRAAPAKSPRVRSPSRRSRSASSGQSSVSTGNGARNARVPPRGTISACRAASPAANRPSATPTWLVHPGAGGDLLGPAGRPPPGHHRSSGPGRGRPPRTAPAGSPPPRAPAPRPRPPPARKRARPGPDRAAARPGRGSGPAPRAGAARGAPPPPGRPPSRPPPGWPRSPRSGRWGTGLPHRRR